jgi:hypothetical protein
VHMPHIGQRGSITVAFSDCSASQAALNDLREN